MDRVLEHIRQIAIKYKVEKVVLFGSRARGDNSPVSDYDIAVFGKDLSALDRACFNADAEEIDTLKKIDIVFVNGALEDELKENIKNDGIIIYKNF
ncbi:MAG: nucleotidyltransferase domain-containing protein [Ruminiclostridium sp.]|nr:nucleotidyltransferase domain-containing protein [Ruminiclostridium sp.]